MTSANRTGDAQIRRSIAARTLGFLRRKLKSYSGPSVYSAQRLSDRRFLRLVDMQTIATASDPGGSNAAKLLLRHFGERIKNRWPGIPDVLTDLRIDMSRMTDKEIVARADSALSGDLHPSGVRPLFTIDGEIDWSSNPTKSREWLLMLHRHGWWPLWGAAYRRTGDEKYAEAFVRQLVDWIDQHPMPKKKSEHHEPWRLMEAGLRMRLSWIPAFGCFFESTAFNDSARFKMLRTLYDHGQFLNTFHTNRNHLVRESNGLIMLALCFPEFAGSNQWLESGLKRLDSELKAQLNVDGSHIEMSVGYQWLTIDEFEVTRALLQEHDLKLPQSDLDEAIQRMYEYLAAVIRPDRTFPQLNDGFILWDAARLENTAANSGWDELEFIASGGTSGLQPSWCSRSFPNAGIHVMRSDWSEDARYLIADTGPYGGPHGHEDKLSFELFACGAPFIVDPGSYTYEKSDPYRNYFVGSEGHNTVLVDQNSQVRRWNPTHMTPQVLNSSHGAWTSTEDCDFASGRYDEGYAAFSLTRPNAARPDFDVTHRRDFLFVKPDYWLLIDYLRASEVHDYQFLFHLAPDVHVESTLDGRAILRSARNGARLLVQAISAGTLSCDVTSGSESPIQGWFSSDHHVKCPAPALVFENRRSASFCVAWLLYPLAPEMRADGVSVRRLEADDRQLLNFVLERDQRVDSFSIQADAANRASGADSTGSAISMNRNGRVIWSAASQMSDR